MLAAFVLSVAQQQPLDPIPSLPIALSKKAQNRLSESARESESNLIRQALDGDQSAYPILVRRYERMIYSLAFQMVRNREDALEVTQDAFLKAFRFLGSYRGESRFSTWLYRIARTSAINHLRRARRETVALDASDSHIRYMRTDLPDGYDLLADADRTVLLQRAFGMLLPADSAVLRLFYIHEQRLEEICSIMDWTMSNAKSRLCRARQRLRTVLEEYFYEEFADA